MNPPARRHPLCRGCFVSGMPSQSKPYGFASSPEGGALGRSVRFALDEQSFVLRENAGPCDRDQKLLAWEARPSA